MSEQTLNLVEVIRQRLQAATRRITLADLLFGLVLTLGIISAIWLISVAIEAGFWLGTTPRSIVFWAFLIVTLGLAGYFLVLPLLRLSGVLRGPSEEAVARKIGSRYPEVADRLVNMLHLVDGRRSNAPEPLVEGAVRMLGEQVRDVPFERVEDFARAKKASRLASLPIVGLLLFLMVAPSTFLDATQRLFSPGATFQRPAPFSLDVQPGDIDLVKGAALDIAVRASGSELPQTIRLSINNLDEDLIEEIRLVPDSTGVYQHSLVNVRHSLRYRLSADPVQTTWYEATITERPLVRSLQVNLAFPNYTGIPAQRLAPNVGDVTALPGTRISLDVGVSGQDMEAAFVRFDDGSLDTLAFENNQATGSFTLRREGTYQIVVRNGSGVENIDPITYSLNLLTDAFPSIVIVEPAPQAELDASLQVGLLLRLNDDFGFSRLRLFYRLAESRFGNIMPEFESLALPMVAPQQLDQEVVHEWLLGQTTILDPVPGDVIEYYVEVRDNDAFAGFKPAKSGIHRLRLPSLAERYDELDEQQDETQDEMEKMMRETDEVRKQFEELRDELRHKQEGDWEDKRQIERLQEQQQQLENRVEDLADQIESATEQMEEHNLVNDETLEMYEELQRVAEEINSPELMEALRELQQSMEEMNLQQMQESIEKFEFNEEMFQQRMERTLDLFKRLQIQQKLDEAALRAEELAKEQERLAEETKKLNEEKESDSAETDSENEESEGEDNEGEQQEGEQQEGEQQEGEQQEGEQQEGEDNEGEQQEGEQQEGEQQEGEQQEGEQQEGEQQEGEQQEGQQNQDQQERAEELAQEQQRSSEEMKQLEEKMKEILERMEEMRNTPSEQMQQLNDQTQQQQLPQQMQQNAEQLQQQQTQDAQEGQQQMQQQLQQLQEQLQQMQSGMQGQQMQINMAGMRHALSDILSLSQDQEALRQNVSNSASDSPLLRDFAQRQIELSEGLSVVSDTLQSLAKEIPEMTREVQKQAGESLRAMGEATEALSERSSRQASGQQKTSMMHLNELALLLSDLMDQMMNSQSSSSGGGQSMQQMIQQLQQMSGQQQQLNQQIQQMLNQMQGQRMTTDMQERMRQIGAQQEAMRRSLKEMSRNRELNDKMMGDLNRIAEQMEETIQELQRGQVNRRTQQRQQQILTRLLDASRSMRERGKQKKREGQQTEDVIRQSPADLNPAEQADQLRRSLLKALDSGYTPDYQELIKRYFELLQQQPQE